MNVRFGSLVVLAAGLLAGCEKVDPHVALLREQDMVRKELIAMLRVIQNEADMQKSRDALAQKYAQVEQVGRRAQAMLAPSLDVVQELQTEMPVWEKTIADLKSEVARVANLPGGPELMASIANP